jgi:pseudouridine kinase
MNYATNATMDSDKRILVIGAAGIDIVGRLTEMPDPGSSVPAEVRPSFGGVARNVAENLAKLDQKVDFITAVGQGVFGKLLLNHLKEAGVNVDACIKTEEFHTSSYLAVISENGSLNFALDDMRILSKLTPDLIQKHESLIQNACCVFFDANVPEESMSVLIEIANQYEIPLYADATSSSLAERLRPHLANFKLLNANTREAEILINHEFEVTGRTSALKAARRLVALGVEILDPTGAGDALSAALIYGLLNDIPLDDTIRLGVKAASLTLRFPGTVLPGISVEKLYDTTMN